MKKPIIVAVVISCILVVAGAVVISQMDWTTSDEKTQAAREAHEAEEVARSERAEKSTTSVVTTITTLPTTTAVIAEDITSEGVPASDGVEVGDGADGSATDGLVSAEADGSQMTAAEAVAETTGEAGVGTTQAGGSGNDEDGAVGAAVSTEATQVAEVTEAASTTAYQGSEVKDGFVQAKIDEHREEIDDTDLAVGSEIYNRLDTFYILDLYDGGLTEEEEAELKAYLEANLSPGEIETARQLYAKYVHLLNE